jgi:hypothetical protein
VSHPSDSERAEARTRGPALKAWLCGLALVALITLAAVAFVAGYGFFGVAATVLAVFAAVELAWLRRARR